MRGDVATFDIHDDKRQSHRRESAAASRRATCACSKSQAWKQLDVPSEYLIERALAKDMVDVSSGEILCPANSVITDEVVEGIREAGIKEIETIYTNDLDCGPYIADTLAYRSHQQQARSVGGNLSHDASGRTADEGSGGEPV